MKSRAAWSRPPPSSWGNFQSCRPVPPRGRIVWPPGGFSGGCCWGFSSQYSPLPSKSSLTHYWFSVVRAILSRCSGVRAGQMDWSRSSLSSGSASWMIRAFSPALPRTGACFGGPMRGVFHSCAFFLRFRMTDDQGEYLQCDEPEVGWHGVSFGAGVNLGHVDHYLPASEPLLQTVHSTSLVFNFLLRRWLCLVNRVFFPLGVHPVVLGWWR